MRGSGRPFERSVRLDFIDGREPEQNFFQAVVTDRFEAHFCRGARNFLHAAAFTDERANLFGDEDELVAEGRWGMLETNADSSQHQIE